MSGFKMLPAKRGTCSMCATKHRENEAHNLQSLFYGMRFLMKWGRDATWQDAVAHLQPEQQRQWLLVAMEMYRTNGLTWTALLPDVDPIAEPYVESLGLG